MKDDLNATISLAREKATNYKLQGFHCSESTIRACSEALGLRLSEDLYRAACGFRGGGGGYGDRCGVIEAGIMIISHLYGRLVPSQEAWHYSYPIRVFHERFIDCFGSIYCRDIHKREEERGADPICMKTYQDGAELFIRLIYDVPELLNAIPPEEKFR